MKCRNELNASIYDPTKEHKPEKERIDGTPTKDGVLSGYETPMSEVCS